MFLNLDQVVYKRTSMVTFSLRIISSKSFIVERYMKHVLHWHSKVPGRKSPNLHAVYVMLLLPV